MSFLWNSTPVVKTTVTNVPIEDNHATDEDYVITSKKENSPCSSMPGLVPDSDDDSDDYNSDDCDPTRHEYISEPDSDATDTTETETTKTTVLLNYSGGYKNLKNGRYDITFNNGDRFVGFINNGKLNGVGKYVIYRINGYPDVQEGQFVDGQFIDGTYSTRLNVMTGSFEIGDDGNDYLDGTDCQIVYNSGIEYSGPVSMDIPVENGVHGEYFIPQNTQASYNGQTGVLTHSNDKFHLTFESGSIKQVSSEYFSCESLEFLAKPLQIEFRDGCVFNGSVFDGDDVDGKDNKDVFTVPNSEDYVDYYKWDDFQTYLWLVVNVVRFPDSFFHFVEDRRLNLRQLSKLNRFNWKKLGLDAIHVIQIKDLMNELYPEY